jgi:hypothetical protein
MSQISRLREANIANGSLIDADDLNSEINQLVSESNGQDTRLTAIESQAVTLNGVKTFGNKPRVPGIDEAALDTGVTIDGCLLRDGSVIPAVAADPTLLMAGQQWYHTGQNVLKLRTASSTRVVGLAKTFLEGPPPLFNTVSTVIVPAGLRCQSDDESALIEFAANTTVTLNVMGANGLDTGSEAANTWYYLWAIANSSTGAVAGLWSASRTTPTLPAGYDKKRLLPVAWRNDASSNLLNMYCAGGWPYRPEWRWEMDTNLRPGGANANVLQLLSGGTAGTFTDVSCGLAVPPISRVAILSFPVWGSGTHNSQIRPKGSTSNGITVMHDMSTLAAAPILPILTDAAQTVQYKFISGTSGLGIAPLGYIVTEVS